MEMPNTDRCVSLLFVMDGAGRQVVEVPAATANVGDLVEYTVTTDDETEIGFMQPSETTVMGTVIKKMDCERFGNEWLCVSELAKIHRGTAVYKPSWSSSKEEP